MKNRPDCGSACITSFGGLTRSDLMSRIRGSRNMTTELRLLSLLRTARISGWRRNSRLPGKPDFVFAAHRVAVFVDGCFWHGHKCGRNLNPRRNAAAWRKKIDGNRKRDLRMTRELRSIGWRVIRIWECELAKRPALCVDKIKRALAT